MWEERAGRQEGTLIEVKACCAMEDARALHLRADRCRAAALAAGSDEARAWLERLARHYDLEARRLNLAEIEGLRRAV